MRACVRASFEGKKDGLPIQTRLSCPDSRLTHVSLPLSLPQQSKPQQAKKKLVYDELHVGDLREWVAEQARKQQRGCALFGSGDDVHPSSGSGSQHQTTPPP